jgi:hypothetical protein
MDPNHATTAYDPWSRGESTEADRLKAAQLEHEAWSREQASKGIPAGLRDGPAWYALKEPT